mmetsp:Transcript_17795/g.54393  ORF Transcript_17795/g.54393 Transcript_17795/m.54393 type:complete len:81 (+) Transcript_17795:1131-1373(+)
MDFAHSSKARSHHELPLSFVRLYLRCSSEEMHSLIVHLRFDIPNTEPGYNIKRSWEVPIRFEMKVQRLKLICISKEMTQF